MKNEVTAIITTNGRPEVLRAIDSAVRQTIRPHVLVVCDRVSKNIKSEIKKCFNNITIVDSQGIGGSAARNTGLGLTDTTWVAHLDDDDCWAGSKVEVQLADLDRANGVLFSTTSANFVLRSGWIVSLPKRRMPKEADGALDSALRRTHLRYNVGFLQTSTFMIQTDAARDVSWDDGLGRHQDWDFFHRFTTCYPNSWTHNYSTLSSVHQGSAQSISRDRDWKASVSWLDGVTNTVGRQAHADMIGMHVLRSGLHEMSAGTLREGLRRLLLLRRVPHPAVIAIDLSEVLGFVARRTRKLAAHG